MSSRAVLAALEVRVAKGRLQRLSTESRRTKAILYRTLTGRSLGLEIGNAVVEVVGSTKGRYRFQLPATPETYPTEATVVLERSPPDSKLDWQQTSSIGGVRLRVGEQYNSSAYKLAGARLMPEQQRLVRIDSPAGLDALLDWYGQDADTDNATPAAPQSDTITRGNAPMPTNLILYGPPGTGKTYATTAEAVRLCDGALPESDDVQAIRHRYSELVKAGQVQFVTFHQSYSYEEFVEGLRPTNGEGEIDGEDGEPVQFGGFRLEPVAGVFREIAEMAGQARDAAAKGQRGDGFDLKGRRFWKFAVGAIGSEAHVFEAAVAGGYVALGWGGDVDWSDPRFTSLEVMREEWATHYPEDKKPSQTRQPWILRNKIAIGDVLIVPYGNSAFRAIAEVTGEYYFELSEDGTYNQRRPVRWLLLLPDRPLPLDTIVDGKFAMRTLYEVEESRIRKEALTRLISQIDVAGVTSRFA